MTAPTLRNPFWPGGFADPFLLKVRGRYHAYASEPEDEPDEGTPIFPILASDDLVTWRPAGHALTALGAPYFRYWAPEVTEHNGQFFLYYAVHTEPFRAAIRVAVAERPEGPFRDAGCDLTSSSFGWAIDPHVFRDDDGQWYLFYTVEYLEREAGLVGSGNVVDRLLDPFNTAGTPARVTPPRHSWQLFEAQRAEKGGVDWYCVEGPAVLRHRGRYYQMFSGGCYSRDNYAVSYAVAPAPMGMGGMGDDSWQESSEEESGLLLRGACGLVSPGHNSVVLGPNNADLYVAYHAWPAERFERCPCLDRLYWHGDTLWTPAPTLTPQPTPARPRLFERFEGGRQDPLWRESGGSWRQTGGEAAQEDATVAHATLAHGAMLGPAWLLEVNVCRRGGAGAFGVALGGDTWVCVLIDPAHARLVVRIEAAALVAAPLPPGFRPDAWHQMRLARPGRVMRATCGHLRAMYGTLPGRLHRDRADRPLPRRVPRRQPESG